MPEPLPPVEERVRGALTLSATYTTERAVALVLEAIAPELALAHQARTIEHVIAQTHAPRAELETARAALDEALERYAALEVDLGGARQRIRDLEAEADA